MFNNVYWSERIAKATTKRRKQKKKTTQRNEIMICGLWAQHSFIKRFSDRFNHKYKHYRHLSAHCPCIFNEYNIHQSTYSLLSKMIYVVLSFVCVASCDQITGYAKQNVKHQQSNIFRDLCNVHYSIR